MSEMNLVEKDKRYTWHPFTQEQTADGKREYNFGDGAYAPWGPPGRCQMPKCGDCIGHGNGTIPNVNGQSLRGSTKEGCASRKEKT